MSTGQPHDNRNAIRYIVAIYIMFFCYFVYVFRSAGKFLGQHVFQEGSLFSVAHPRFSLVNNTLALVLGAAVIGLSLLNANLKEYIDNVGDELTRVSWAGFSDTRKTVGMILVIVALSASLLFVMDLAFIKTINALLSTAH